MKRPPLNGTLEKGRMTAVPEANMLAPSAYYGPTNFSWLVKGRLAGMPRPGIVRPIHEDIDAIKRMGVSVVVTLTDEWEPPVDQFQDADIKCLHVPMPDMHPPTMDQALETCAFVDKCLADDRAVVFHCRAGKGRTGTLLTAQLIWYEPDSDVAIRQVKNANHKWIESQEQLDFLAEFAEFRR